MNVLVSSTVAALTAGLIFSVASLSVAQQAASVADRGPSFHTNPWKFQTNELDQDSSTDACRRRRCFSSVWTTTFVPSYTVVTYSYPVAVCRYRVRTYAAYPPCQGGFHAGFQGGYQGMNGSVYVGINNNGGYPSNGPGYGQGNGGYEAAPNAPYPPAYGGYAPAPRQYGYRYSYGSGAGYGQVPGGYAPTPGYAPAAPQTPGYGAPAEEDQGYAPAQGGNLYGNPQEQGPQEPAQGGGTPVSYPQQGQPSYGGNYASTW